MSMFLFFCALTTTVKSTTANGVLASRKTLVPRLAIFCSTYRFAPCTRVITVIKVATPMVKPSTVRAARSLCARRASAATRRSSLKLTMGGSSTSLNDGGPLAEWPMYPNLPPRHAGITGDFMANELIALSSELADVVGKAGKSVAAVDARPRYGSSGVFWRPGIVVTAEHTVRREEEIELT